MTALVVALAGRGDGRAAATMRALEGKAGRLEAEVAELRSRLEAVSRGRTATRGGGEEAARPAEWPVVARRLAVDLELDSAQADLVDKTLEQCAEELEAAEKRKSALWRDRLSKRARREAYAKIAACLRADQKTALASWLEAPGNSHLSCWLLPEKPCGGCGRSRARR